MADQITLGIVIGLSGLIFAYLLARLASAHFHHKTADDPLRDEACGDWPHVPSIDQPRGD